jgi:hypothetical protein
MYMYPEEDNPEFAAPIREPKGKTGQMFVTLHDLKRSTWDILFT